MATLEPAAPDVRSSPIIIVSSDWHAAPVAVDGGCVFVIGDVHGCHDHLRTLLETFGPLALSASESRLVYLGDLISRGPSSLAALAIWADPARHQSFERVHRLWGNHEQLLMLAIAGHEPAAAAVALWLEKGKLGFVEEVRQRLGLGAAPIVGAHWPALFTEALGPSLLQCLAEQERHVQIGNILCVHGGLNPEVSLATSLAPPWTEIGGTHWASIRLPFLTWRGGFQGLMVVHGHTPPDKHRRLSGYPDPHVFQHDRLCLDGGSAVTGVVAAAQFEDGRYRLFWAQSPGSAAARAQAPAP